MPLMKQDTQEPLPLLNPYPSFSLSQKLPTPHIVLFLTEINSPLPGQISDETWYTGWHLAWTIYLNGRSQNQ